MCLLFVIESPLLLPTLTLSEYIVFEKFLEALCYVMYPWIEYMFQCVMMYLAVPFQNESREFVLACENSECPPGDGLQQGIRHVYSVRLELYA